MPNDSHYEILVHLFGSPCNVDHSALVFVGHRVYGNSQGHVSGAACKSVLGTMLASTVGATAITNGTVQYSEYSHSATYLKYISKMIVNDSIQAHMED